jgi:hypothetical protein
MQSKSLAHGYILDSEVAGGAVCSGARLWQALPLHWWYGYDTSHSFLPNCYVNAGRSSQDLVALAGWPTWRGTSPRQRPPAEIEVSLVLDVVSPLSSS